MPRGRLSCAVPLILFCGLLVGGCGPKPPSEQFYYDRAVDVISDQIAEDYPRHKVTELHVIKEGDMYSGEAILREGKSTAKDPRYLRVKYVLTGTRIRKLQEENQVEDVPRPFK